MLIGLYNLEPKIENTAMMQVSEYHKKNGDHVEIYSPIFHNRYDQIYAFSIFSFTNKSGVRKGMLCGGTGGKKRDVHVERASQEAWGGRFLKDKD